MENVNTYTKLRDGIAIATIAAPGTPAPRAATRPAGGRCRHCGGEVRNAPHHRAMGGLCGSCAFDEYDC